MIYSNLEFKIENSKDNIEILKVNNNGKDIYIGSKYNMNSLIGKFLMDIEEDIESDSILIIYGFGTGEHIKRLSEKFPQNMILVFEPNLELKEFISKQTWILENNHLKVICDESIGVYEYIETNIEVFKFTKIKISSFANYKNVYSQGYKKFREDINVVIKKHIIISQTYMEFNQRWFEATLNNIPGILKSNSINEYINRFKNKPAIIVSAGPSLEKNIKELKDAKDKIMIISGGRTLKPLLNIDIKPDLLSIIDSGEPSYKLVEDYINDIDIPLFFYEKTNEKVIEAHKGRKIFATQSDLIRKIVNKDVLDCISGGSVAHSMTRAAIEMGCNPIIFIGQDLAYTNERTHAAISKYKYAKTVENAEVEFTDSMVEAVDGGTVRTSAILNTFRIELEELIQKYPDLEFINATEGGARIKGTTEIPLKECIEKYGVCKTEFRFEDDNNKDEKVLLEHTLEVLMNLKKNELSIKDICKSALRLLEDLKLNYILKKQGQVDKILQKLAEMDMQIEKRYKEFKDIETVIYPIMYKAAVGKKTNEGNPLESIIGNSKMLYQGIIDELEKIEPIIDKTIITLNNKNE